MHSNWWWFQDRNKNNVFVIILKINNLYIQIFVILIYTNYSQLMVIIDFDLMFILLMTDWLFVWVRADPFEGPQHMGWHWWWGWDVGASWLVTVGISQPADVDWSAVWSIPLSCANCGFGIEKKVFVRSENGIRDERKTKLFTRVLTSDTLFLHGNAVRCVERALVWTIVVYFLLNWTGEQNCAN